MLGVSPRVWNMEELVGLVADAVVAARDAHAAPLDLPAALADACQPTADRWEQQLAASYAHDRAVVVDLWQRAIQQPGTHLRGTIRRRFPDSWAETELHYLNLLHQHDVGCVLVAARRIRDIEAPREDVDGKAAVYDSPAAIVQHLDELAIVLRTEGDVQRIFGRLPEELEGRAIVEHIHADDLDTAVGMWLEVIGSPDAIRTIQQRICQPDGAEVWVLSTVMNRLDDSGTVLAVSHDITDARAQHASLQANEQELRFLAEEVPVAVFRADDDCAITFANGRWHDLFAGVRTMQEAAEQLQADDRAPFLDACHATIANGGTSQVEVRCLDERVLAFRLRGVGSTGDPAPEGLIGTVEDVTAATLATAALRHHAERDPLTDLANRRAISQILAQAVATDRSPVVLFGDLDDFKRVNDERGHDAGDDLLTAIGQRFRQAVRPGDVVGRWGGDEFVVVCHDVAEGGEHDLRDRLHQALDREPIRIGDWDYEPSISLGAVRARAGESAEDVLRRADNEMYGAKRLRHRS